MLSWQQAVLIPPRSCGALVRIKVKFSSSHNVSMQRKKIFSANVCLISQSPLNTLYSRFLCLCSSSAELCTEQTGCLLTPSHSHFLTARRFVSADYLANNTVFITEKHFIDCCSLICDNGEVDKMFSHDSCSWWS